MATRFREWYQRVPPSILVASDTAVLAATSAILLIITARTAPADEFLVFSMLQLIVTIGVGLQRAIFLNTALVTERVVGARHIPFAWVLRITPVFASACAFGVWAVLAGLGVQGWAPVLSGVLISFVALGQDCLRYARLSRRQPGVALASDLTGLLTLGGLMLGLQPASWFATATVWGLSLIAACAVALFGGSVRDADGVARSTVREIWPLGKWAGVDAGLSGFATLLPILFVAIALSSPLAALYRLFQVAQGPLNVLSAALTTHFALGARSSGDGHGSRATSLRQAALLGLGSAIYMTAAVYLISLISDVQGNGVVFVGAVVVVCASLGSFAAPLSASSLALGKQKIAALLRGAIVLFSGLIVAAASVNLLPEWLDPIAVTSLFSAGVAAVVWSITFVRSVRAT